MEDKDFGKSFLFSCYFDKAFGHEQFVPEHVLSFQVSGETHVDHQNGKLVVREGQMIIARRNQLAKAFKYPSKNKEYRAITVVLDSQRLKQFALNNHISTDKKYTGSLNLLLENNRFLESYFHSLTPYALEADAVSLQMETLKINEAITLLVETHPTLKVFLFDFSEPFKIDLEKFMIANYQYNVPLENFAKLSGRSLASFKRDFEKIFGTSPRKWLKERRLSEAYQLIEKSRRKPADFYLDLGFENLSHFYTAFKEKFGVTPAALINK